MDDRMDEVPDADPVVSCSLQGGTISVFEDCVLIDRSSASMFEDKRIPFEEVEGVEYERGLMTGHVQVLQTDVEPADAGFLSHPVDENTLYVPRGQRDCAQRLRDAILERSV
ncbi:hypothetical protein [Halobacterium bonnevillei]|uniref:Uncharacterized protein n=1 Tax=Halobacterium bonnevillei TaxID=2692200 RepID=A0A6B0SD56_9EURY|nr:hypothetical protein [Halobacterium bonnevillei]MXR19675.1 hypothetical protein [Halobacterium bonnevillei]